MFCKNCGRELPADSKFCLNCGAPVPVPVTAPSPETICAPAPETICAPAPAVKTGWPAIIPIFMIVGFAAGLLGIAAYSKFVMENSSGTLAARYAQIGLMIIPCFLEIAAIVLFFVHTRRKPFLTAIPRMIGVVWSAVLTLISLSEMLKAEHIPGGFAVTQIIMIAVGLLPLALYLVAVFAKPRTVVIAVLHLLLTTFLCLLPLLSIDWRHMTAGTFAPYGVYTALSVVGSLINGAAWSIACFLLRRKYYPRKN